MKKSEHILMWHIIYCVLIEKYKDHQLIGQMKAYSECHIKSDLLLVCMIEDETLKLVDIGSHSELFE